MSRHSKDYRADASNQDAGVSSRNGSTLPPVGSRLHGARFVRTKAKPTSSASHPAQSHERRPGLLSAAKIHYSNFEDSLSRRPVAAPAETHPTTSAAVASWRDPLFDRLCEQPRGVDPTVTRGMETRRTRKLKRLLRAICERQSELNGGVITLFRKIDADGDQAVTFEEFKAGLEALHIPFDIESLTILMEECDQNNSGTVDYMELALILHEFKKRLLGSDGFRKSRTRAEIAKELFWVNGSPSAIEKSRELQCAILTREAEAEARDADVIAKAIRAHRRAAQALVAMAHAPEAPTAVSKDFVSKLWVDHTKNPEHGMSELTAQRRFVEASALYLKYA